MTKIFPHCTISVGLAPLADYIYDEDFSPLYDKCGARAARQIIFNIRQQQHARDPTRALVMY